MRSLIRTLSSILLLISIVGCGGGSKGTGGDYVKGYVVNTSSKPVAGVTVTVVETGDDGITDVAGAFNIATILPAGALNLNVTNGTSLDQTLKVTDLPANANTVQVKIRVDEAKNEVDVDDVGVSEDDSGDEDNGSDDGDHDEQESDSQDGEHDSDNNDQGGEKPSHEDHGSSDGEDGGKGGSHAGSEDGSGEDSQDSSGDGED